jgi:hypothetical protein
MSFIICYLSVEFIHLFIFEWQLWAELGTLFHNSVSPVLKEQNKITDPSEEEERSKFQPEWKQTQDRWALWML